MLFLFIESVYGCVGISRTGDAVALKVVDGSVDVRLEESLIKDGVPIHIGQTALSSCLFEVGRPALEVGFSKAQLNALLTARHCLNLFNFSHQDVTLNAFIMPVAYTTGV